MISPSDPPIDGFIDQSGGGGCEWMFVILGSYGMCSLWPSSGGHARPTKIMQVFLWISFQCLQRCFFFLWCDESGKKTKKNITCIAQCGAVPLIANVLVNYVYSTVAIYCFLFVNVLMMCMRSTVSCTSSYLWMNWWITCTLWYDALNLIRECLDENYLYKIKSGTPKT